MNDLQYMHANDTSKLVQFGDISHVHNRNISCQLTSERTE